MKILVIQDALRSGGTERQSVFLSNAFAAAGHGTTLLTFRPGGRLAPTVAPAVHRWALQPVDLGLDWLAPGLGSVARHHRPDVVLCMGRMANCYAGAVQKRVPGAAVLATMRTGKPLPWLFRRSLGRVRHVIANSRDARDVLATRYGVPVGKISVIYNSLVFPPERTGGVENARSAQRERLRAEYGASTATTVLLCVAMFRAEKNQRELVEIVAAMPPQVDVQLWLAGDGPARQSCEQLTRTLHADARVKFVGFHSDPTALYAAADAAVHASSSESLSNFLIEAQAHGVPAVAYEAQGIAECFVPGETGWAIPRGDRKQFQERILALIAEPAAGRDRRMAEARAFARQTFDPQLQVQAYLDLFDRFSRDAKT
jgi:glycosyltransferase involved in cell wall biosynthesis